MAMLNQVIRIEPKTRQMLLVLFSPFNALCLTAHGTAWKTLTNEYNPVISPVFTDMSFCCTVNPKQVLFLGSDTKDCCVNKH